MSSFPYRFTDQHTKAAMFHRNRIILKGQADAVGNTAALWARSSFMLVILIIRQRFSSIRMV